MYEQDGITEVFYELMAKLNSIEHFLNTLKRLELMTDDEARVIYHQSHTICIEQMRMT
jgi:hypothetical protein